MEKTFKFRIYPNKQQEELIQKTFGCVRFVYNLFLARRIAAYKDNKEFISFVQCSRELTVFKKGFIWLKEPDKNALQNALKNLEQAYKNFFKHTHKFPKFKSKKNRHKSYRTNSTTVKVLKGYIKLPKLGLVKYRDNQTINGRILNATIKQTPYGKYYVSVCCTDIQNNCLKATNDYVGIDFGLKEFAVLSDGKKYVSPKYLKQSLKKLAKLQKELSRKQIGSSNWEKSRIKVARLFAYITNQRTDWLQKLSIEIVRNYDVISIEDIAISNIVKNHSLARSIVDVSWYEFTRQLDYKCKWYGKIFVKINRFYPSSQLCNICGYRNKKMKNLNIRSWICPKCGINHDRDINASINILTEGLRQVGVIV